jgi:hypothetical protein
MGKTYAAGTDARRMRLNENSRELVEQEMSRISRGPYMVRYGQNVSGSMGGKRASTTLHKYLKGRLPWIPVAALRLLRTRSRVNVKVVLPKNILEKLTGRRSGRVPTSRIVELLNEGSIKGRQATPIYIPNRMKVRFFSPKVVDELLRAGIRPETIMQWSKMKTLPARPQAAEKKGR